MQVSDDVRDRLMAVARQMEDLSTPDDVIQFLIDIAVEEGTLDGPQLASDTAEMMTMTQRGHLHSV